MRPGTYRDKLKRMQNHVSCLQSKANQLLREQSNVQLQVDVFDGLLCARDAWAGVIRSVLQPGWESDELLQQIAQQGMDEELQQLLNERPQMPPEHILQQLPLLPALSHIDRSLHASVMCLTPDLVAKQWVAYISDTMSLLVMHELDPQLATPLLEAHMQHVAAWLLCLYFFNTNVAFQLHNINLLTRENTPAPEGHWQGVFESAQLTQQQRSRIAIANQFCQPRLQQLQQEQQALMQQLAELHTPAAADDPAEDQAAAAAAAAAATQPGTPSFPCLLDGEQAAGGPGHTVLPLELAALTAPGGPLHTAAAAAAALEPSSLATGAAMRGAAWAGGSDGSISSTSSTSSGTESPATSSNHARQRQMAKANELTQKIAANCRAWRIVTSMRAHYSAAVMTPVQLARMVTSATPYLLIGAPIYDKVIASNPMSTPPKKRGGC